MVRMATKWYVILKPHTLQLYSHPIVPIKRKGHFWSCSTSMDMVALGTVAGTGNVKGTKHQWFCGCIAMRREWTARPSGRFFAPLAPHSAVLNLDDKKDFIPRPYMEANPLRTGEATMEYLGRSTWLDHCGHLKVGDKVPKKVCSSSTDMVTLDIVAGTGNA